MKIKPLRFNMPYVGKDEAMAASNAIYSNKIVGNGDYGQRCEAMLKSIFGVRHALLTTSCTHALELALMSMGIRPGDEVICPSFTFVSTANAAVRQKAVPVFVEADENTLNIDIKDMKKRITGRTRAIIPVHYAGISCDMDEILDIARKNNIVVIEDAAHGIGAKYKDRYLGTIGDMGCFSFHATKNITCGEGGVLMTGSDGYYRRAEIGREKGTNRAAYMHGEVSKYSWVDEGSSFVLSDILAAVLIEQLRKMDEVTKKRRRIFEYYLKGLKCLEDEGRILLPRVNGDCEVNGHIFYFRMHTEKERNRCIEALKKKGIEATFHFLPLHASPYGMKVLGYNAGDFPVTERVSRTLLRLPIYPQLTRPKLDFIIDSVIESIS